ncbi:hypothetical protein ACO2JO_04860 [Leptospira interrogans]
MFTQLLVSTTRYLGSSLGAAARRVQDLRARLKTYEELREARGITLLREWLSDDQRRQFDASKSFEVIGSNSGKRYRITHGTGTNVQELAEDGQPVMGFCFVPDGGLVAGDVMLAQKIALETNERAALAVANKFPTRGHDRANPPELPRRPY